MWPCFLVILLLSQSALSRKKQKPSINSISGSIDDTQKYSSSECRFGGQSHELEDTWHPDLGPPFGIMFCVHCECVPIHKKRRIVGRVRCKNIKSECPKPSCPEPILLPGRCCKVCPGQDNNPDNNIQVDLEREEQEKNGRHYASVLSGPGVPGAAIGRLHFRKKTLQWSLVSSERLSAPIQLTFTDPQDNILDEFPTPITDLYNSTGKMCGTWARLPRKYRRILRAEELRISLTYPEGVIVGAVKKYYGLTSELFSGFLEGLAGVGTAVLSVDIGTGSIHVNILFKGIVKEGELNVPFHVRFETTRDGETRILDETVILETAGEDLSSLEIRTVMDNIELDALGRGEMKLILYPSSVPERSLSGFLVPRISCDLLDCVLTPRSQDEGMRGMGFMYFNRHGALIYKIRVEPGTTSVSQISLESGGRSKRILNIEPNLGSTDGTVASGEMRLTGNQVEELMKEEYYLSVGSSSTLLRGRVMLEQAGPSNLAGEPVLLTGNSSVAGLSWVSLDTDCRLHYSLRMEGANLEATESVLDLEDYPLENLKALPLFPSHKRQLQVCQGKRCSGHADSLHKLTVSRLDSGDAALILSLPDGQLKGGLETVDTPISCLPIHNRNSLERIPGYLNDLGEKVPNTILQKCYYEGVFYDDGTQWESSHTQCQMCSCQRGSVVCDPMVCPSTDCADPIIPEGECCSTCALQTNSTEGCIDLGGNSRIHPPGSRWHPYIPPFGFSRCAICSCQEDTLTVQCTMLILTFMFRRIR
ncbi:dorsal-ventral patterning protein Sog [Eurytemora carolleeae]|uniref:dorsal-ventral patterning protein Sog n=1 Tax=Eurytemora carolleeae TaxID=1294199 RepID=UPI000C787EB8|nr:dorsal-ventral patterning protein Sog [Eurytemora carolleeae]|eukprot:XP_023344783.1 dorsal-ventral patterning protein Sog-like [Eurytemora affinis]